ncbi:MAG: pimeloyl-ACP methyl ester carboxylesterase [Urechidicola sp.]|jgi:pimeloyl-ACP methyl ester carboxylesterase|tara:strand:- start:22747 stop:23631 length:885 start_codon:yes stop_codon:yes gene_type:complete
MKNLLYIILILSVFGCLKMDDLPFLGEKLTEYKFEDYKGDSELVLPESYRIADSNIHLFSLNSKLPNESTGETIYAVYVGNINTIATDSLIVYCHGQSKHMDVYWQRAKLLANIGGKNRYGVLMMDYRGFGLSTGKSTEASMYQDVRTCMDWVSSKRVPNNNVIMYGYSLGTIPAIDISAFYTATLPTKLILESPLASAENLTEEALFIDVSPSFFTSLVFDNVEKIKSVSQPLIWIHGVNDDYLSITNGEAIYERHGGTYKEAHRISGANHSDVPTIMGYQDYSEKVLRFITK